MGSSSEPETDPQHFMGVISINRDMGFREPKKLRLRKKRGEIMGQG